MPWISTFQQVAWLCGWESNGEDEAGDEHDSESLPSITKSHDTVKQLSYDFAHTALSNMMNGAFWTSNGHWFVWNLRLHLFP